MSARVSLHRTRCDEEGEFADYDDARRALRQHGNHAYGCIQFVAAEAYMLGSADAA